MIPDEGIRQLEELENSDQLFTLAFNVYFDTQITDMDAFTSLLEREMPVGGRIAVGIFRELFAEAEESDFVEFLGSFLVAARPWWFESESYSDIDGD